MSTSWQAFSIGLRERLPIGSAFILGIDAGYGDTASSSTTPSARPRSSPAPTTSTCEGRSTVASFEGTSPSTPAPGISTSCRPETWRPSSHESVGGVEASLGVADQVGSAVELSLDLVYTRFFYSLLPQPGDPYVAGGALDQMATISLGVAYLF